VNLHTAAAIAALAWSVTATHAAVPVEFSAAELATLATHGPWPVPWAGDPSNRVSRNRDAIQFGHQLFFDARFSKTGTVSCATCHQPEKQWSDGRKLGVALAEVDRSTQPLANVRLNRWFSWDGGHDNLWAQSIRPLLDAREMGINEKQAAELVRGDATLSCQYQRVFGAAPGTDDERVLVDLGKALAAFQETLHTGRTPFDDFRDALVRGDRKAAAQYPPAAQRGAKIFAGRGNCSLCHFGPNFTHGEFHEIGIPIYRKSGGVDWGALSGHQAVAGEPVEPARHLQRRSAARQRHFNKARRFDAADLRAVPGARPAQCRAHRALYA
jgi:cytochrome c peroxidase